MTIASSARRNEVILPGLAWLTVFIPALSYFLATRFNSLQLDSLGTVAPCSVDSVALDRVFIFKHEKLQNPLVLIDDCFHDIVAIVWRHDADLERGYLLLSQSHGSGRIWRWERGGGPIPIGKTLAMDPSGCRSKPSCKSQDGENGSGALAVDFHKQDNFRQGSLVVAEWGEGRIVKLEEGTGARTPLVMSVPDACKHASARPRRVQRPTSMLYTPTGDLLFMEQASLCSTVMRLHQAVHVPPLESAMTSRIAHKWNETHHDNTIDVLYRETKLGSMALDSKGEGLYVTVKRGDNSVLLVHLPLLEDDDDDEEKEANSQVSGTQMGLLYDAAIVRINLTDIGIISEPPQAMAVDENGNVFLAISSGLLVLDDGMEVLGKLTTPTPMHITSLTLGEDKFLYITTSTQLLRIRVRHGPPKLPTNLVKKKKIAIK